MELARPINPPLADPPDSTPSGTGRAVFAGGCFWGVQAVFQHTLGVTNAVSGYAGGTQAGPSYEQVSSGGTGHAKSVEITFDPKQISFGRLLQIYFSVAHDPTQLNRQGPDEGTQYRSEIFATSDAQQRAAEAYIAELDKAHVFARPDRDQGGTAEGILSRRALSSGLCHASSRQPLYRGLRSAKNRKFEKALPGVLPRAGGARGRRPTIKRISKMLRRDLLSMMALAAVGGFVFPTWLLAEAEKLEVTKTDEEWRRLLTPAQYQVLRHEDTEPAFSSPLLDEHRKGVFACAGCELPLFKSETKFESGTGWPSFWSPIEGAVGTKTDRSFWDAAHRGALPALRRASWPCL